MSRSRRLLLFLITFLPIVVLVIVSAMYVMSQLNSLARQSNVIIAEELGRRFKREVRVGKAEVGKLGTAVIENVRVAKGKTFREGTLASARKVVVLYDWRAMLFGGKGAASVREVIVVDPDVELIRRVDGSLNITDLFKPPPGPHRPPFSGKVRIIGGHATFYDYAVRPGERPVPIRLQDMTAIIDSMRHPIYTFSGDVRGRSGQFTRADFKGRYSATSRRIEVFIDGRNVAAARLALYAIKSKKVQVISGILDTKLSLDARRKEGHYAISVAGTTAVRNATVRLSLLRSPATEVNGRIVLEGNRASARLMGMFAGAPIRASGALSDFKNPVLDVSLDSPGIDAGRLIAATTFLGALSQFEPSGRGPVHAKLTGSLANLTVNATATVPNASIRGVPVQNLALSAQFHANRVDLQSIRFAAKGAKITASGYIITRPATVLALRGSFIGVNLARIPAKTDFAATGIASGTFALSGSAANPSLSVNARVVNGSVADVPFGIVQGNLGVVGSRVEVNDLKVLGVMGGSLHASGFVSASGMDLSISAESLDIDLLARRFDIPGTSGTAFINGRITGNLRFPRMGGVLEVFSAKAEGYTIDHALVAFAADRNKITVSQGIVQMFPAELRFSGEASNLRASRVTFRGKADVRRLEVTKLLELSQRRLDVTGTILSNLSFSGAYLPRVQQGQSHFIDISATGSLSLEDATAFGYPVEGASAKLEYSGNKLKLADAVVTSDGARLALDGIMSTDTGIVDASFSLTGFDLLRLQENLGEYVVLAGTAGVTGTIQGPVDNVKATVSAKIDELAVNYDKFDRAEARLAYSDGKFTSFSVGVSRAGQSLEVSGSDFDPATYCVTSLKGALTDVSVPDILDIVRASPFFSSEKGKPIAQSIGKMPKLTSGRVNGSFALSGCFKSSEGRFMIPDGTLDIVANNVGIDVQQIQSIEMRVSSKNGVVALDTFQAISEDTSLVVSGPKAFENGSLHLEVRVENARLSRLAPWLGPRTPEGILSAVFNIDGAWDSPQIVGSVEVVKPGYGGLTLDRLRASMIQITPSRIEIPDILLSMGGHQATASASVPWDWSTLSVPNDEPISVTADMGKQNLNMLSAFLPSIDSANTTGSMDEAWFSLSGTLLDPQMAGSLKVNGGTIAFRGFTNTFTNVMVGLGFAGDRIVVNSMSAVSSEGGSVHVVPGGYVTVGILGASEMNLRVVANGLKIGEKNVLGLKEDVSTQIDAGLSVMGPTINPTVADAAVEGQQGGVTLSHAKLAFQTVPNRGEWTGPTFFNPSFAVSLRIGQDVIISPPSLQLIVTGGGMLTGTLARPEVKSLELDLVSGEIGLATAKLRVMPGGKIHVSYMPPAPPDVQLDFQATASVFAFDSLRQRQRYQITMRVTGQAAKPQIDLSSTPPGLTREQMLAALGHVPALFTSAEAGLQTELAGVLTAAATSTLFAPIENLFVQRLGFEQFSLEFSPIYPLSIYVSRPLFGNFYLAFYRQITTSLITAHDVQYQVVLSYRLKNTYQFSVGADDQQTLTFQVGYAKAFR